MVTPRFRPLDDNRSCLIEIVWRDERSRSQTEVRCYGRPFLALSVKIINCTCYSVFAFLYKIYMRNRSFVIIWQETNIYILSKIGLFEVLYNFFVCTNKQFVFLYFQIATFIEKKVYPTNMRCQNKKKSHNKCILCIYFSLKLEFFLKY